MFNTMYSKLMKNILSVVKWTLVIVLLIFSVEYFIQISIFFGVFVALLEVSKVFYLNNVDNVKSKSIKIIMLFICVLITGFSVFGTVSNSYNLILKSNNKNYKIVHNKEYDTFKSTFDRKNVSLQEYKTQLINFPTLEKYIEDSKTPKWEDKTNIINSYNSEKQKIADNIKTLEVEIDKLKEPSKTVKINLEVKTGYLPIMIQVSKITKIEVDTLILLLTLILALIVESIIYTTSFISNRLNIKIEKIDILDPEVEVIEDIEEHNISPEINHNESVEEIKQLVDDNIIDTIREYLLTTYRANERIKKFQDQFNLSRYDYEKIRNSLKDEEIIYTKNKNMYLSDKVVLIGGRNLC